MFILEGLACLGVLQVRYDFPTTTYSGFNKMLELISWNFSWPQMWKTVEEFIFSWQIYSRSKNPWHCLYSLLHRLYIPKQPWSCTSMDFTTFKFIWYYIYDGGHIDKDVTFSPLHKDHHQWRDVETLFGSCLSLSWITWWYCIGLKIAICIQVLEISLWNPQSWHQAFFYISSSNNWWVNQMGYLSIRAIFHITTY